jgi:hypothetical protein
MEGLEFLRKLRLEKAFTKEKAQKELEYLQVPYQW